MILGLQEAEAGSFLKLEAWKTFASLKGTLFDTHIHKVVFSIIKCARSCRTS